MLMEGGEKMHTKAETVPEHGNIRLGMNGANTGGGGLLMSTEHCQ
jgi:hypothetical protein